MYLLSTKQGIITAQCNLGICYMEQHNYVVPVKWFKIASQNKDPLAQSNLGLCYLYGDGVKHNSKKSFKYFKLACKTRTYRFPKTSYALLEKGCGIRKNNTKVKNGNLF